jgi:hypothetical protein
MCDRIAARLHDEARVVIAVLTLSPRMPSLWGRSDHALPTAQELAETWCRDETKL